MVDDTVNIFFWLQYYHPLLMKKLMNLLFLSLFLNFAHSLPSQDKVNHPPGMPQVILYSGFLPTATANRQLHYILVVSNTSTDPTKFPLTLWLNGGPGCSSLIGLFQQIGPYSVGANYTFGDNLTKNEFSWDRASHLLFIESPGIAGFSSDTNIGFQYTDQITASDCFAAVMNFLTVKAPQLITCPLFLAGEQYAGKYLPDLATLIIANNRNSKQYVNLTGVFIGNGVINNSKESSTRSQIDYMINHDFISPRLEAVYRSACQRDFLSPRCNFLTNEIQTLRLFLNIENIYEVCSQQSSSLRLRSPQTQESLQGIPPCPSDESLKRYLNLNKFAYNIKNDKTWSPCSRLIYKTTENGSTNEYRTIFLNKAIRVWLYSGDWDSNVPLTDTLKNLQSLGRKKAGNWDPWFANGIHSGFYQTYEGALTLISVKAAGQRVPQSQPEASYKIFYNFVNNRTVDAPVS